MFDTTVIISAALIKNSVPRQAFDPARSAGKLLLSWPTIAELPEKLSQQRFDKYVTPNERMLLLAALVRDSYWLSQLKKSSNAAILMMTDFWN
ncbi:MAG: hypothetical protein ONB42_08370 [candidate division KSB1 bacterium]|nr:hypothetical protein [candidate division KSB1 bacterium]MDZ7311939.1 hypothetical protein [candidate division KSB1 bacterium]